MLYIKKVDGVTMFNFVPHQPPKVSYKEPILIPKIKNTINKRNIYDKNKDDIDYIVDRYISLTPYILSPDYTISFNYTLLYNDLQKWVIDSM